MNSRWIILAAIFLEIGMSGLGESRSGLETLPMNRRLRTRMLLFIAGPTLVIFVGVMGVTLSHLRAESEAAVRGRMIGLARDYAARFDAAFERAALVARSTARGVEINPGLTEAQIFERLSWNVAQSDVVYGAAMAFEPGMYRAGDELFCPYVYRGEGSLNRMNISRGVSDWYGEERWEWWHVPKKTGLGVWTDPYFDDGAGNVFMVTYSEPFFREGEFWGVTTIDIMLDTLRNEIASGFLKEDQRFSILTSDGRVVYSEREDLKMQSLIEVVGLLGRADMDLAVREIVEGGAGIEVLEGWDVIPDGWEGWGETQWVFHAPIESNGWVFLAPVSEREALAEVSRRMAVVGGSLGATLLAIIGAIWYMSGRITRPIEALREKVLEISGGNLEVRVDGSESRDEIGELGHSFNKMAEDLRAQIEALASEQAARQKVERDLDLAREIQQGLLPTETPDVRGFEIAGWNRPADKTGGDYFDWMTLPDGRLLVTIADVTGHGIGPALIVAVCRAYMRAAASGEQVELGDAIARVNGLLCGDMVDGRFVTAAVGVLDWEGRELSLVSAGQAPMFFYEASSGQLHNWDADELPLGIFEDVAFDEVRRIHFALGDMLVLTTDGFFEWANPEGEQFGIERLKAFVCENAGLDAQAFIDKLYGAVVLFADGTEQPDDLTAVVIRGVAE